MNIHIPTHFNGYFIKHRFTSLLLDLGILNLRQYCIYIRFLEVADWRTSNPSFGCIQGTREEILKKMFPNNRCSSQAIFNSCSKRLIGLGLVMREKRLWRIPNFHLHLEISQRPGEFRELLSRSENGFYTYLRSKLQNPEEIITETVISEVKEMVISYLTDEDTWVSYSVTNKDNESTVTEVQEELPILPESNPN